MHLEQPDAANASSIQKFPMLDQRWFFLNWKLPLQSPQHTSEHLCLFFFGGIIAGKMDIDTAARQLRIDFAKRTHLIRSYQDVTHTRCILEILSLIHISE